MEVILKQDVKSLGYKDDIVKVKNGYGRNFLIPQGFAVIANEPNRKMHTEYLKQTQFKQDRIKNLATDMAEGLKAITVKIGAKAGESGKIFGAVNTIQFAEELKKLGFEVDRKRITFETDVKFVGSYIANLNLHKEVKIQVPFEVIAV